MIKYIYIFILFMLSFYHNAYCQDPPIGILPMYYNPSFAGSVGNSRICFNGAYAYQSNDYGRSQNFYDINFTRYGFFSSFDRFYPGIKSGLGFSVERIDQKETFKGPNYEWQLDLVQSIVTAVFAPKLSIKGKYTLSPSIDLSFINQDILYNETYNSENSIYDIDKNGITSRVGILFNARQYYIGYAVRLYNSELNEIGNYKYDFYSILQLGYTFQKDEDSKISFTPQLALPIHSKANQWDQTTELPSYNLSFRYSSFILSALSQFEYIYPTGFQVGWQNSGWRLLISNEFAHRYYANLTIRYIFNQDKKSINILNNLY